MDYNGLQQAIITYSLKSGDTDFAAMVPTFIALFENDIVLKNIRVPWAVTAAQSQVLDPNGYLALPDDFISMQACAALTDPVSPISIISPQMLYQAQAQNPNLSGGYPNQAAVVGTMLRLFPAPATPTTANPSAVPTTVEMIYYAAPPPLGSLDSMGNTITTNVYLQNVPKMYLYGSLTQAAQYMMSDELLEKWQALYNGQLDDINKYDQSVDYPAMSQIIPDNIY